MLSYFTFYARADTWMLFEGIGIQETLLGQRLNTPELIDFGTTQKPVLWMCYPHESPDRFVVEQVQLPDLSAKHTITVKKRLSAIAVSPDGQQVIILQVPSVSNGIPLLSVWNGQTWRQPDISVTPDISSRLAWFGDHLIAFEATNRRLAVLDLEAETVKIGPTGCWPAAAPIIGQWYAISDSQVAAFDAQPEFRGKGVPIAGFRFGRVTSLRVTLDGQVFSWTEPRFWFGSKAFSQQRNRRRIHFRQPKHGLWVVIGPYEFSTGKPMDGRTM